MVGRAHGGHLGDSTFGKIKRNEPKPAKTRRRLARLIKFSKKELIELPTNFVSYFSDPLNPPQNFATVIVDSGTVYHINRRKEDFRHISQTQVRIKGVSGMSYGRKGVLKPSALGTNLPAIWYKDLPVDCLVSVEGLKQQSWETHFLLDQNLIRNKITGDILYLNQ